jgi:hypothetical protein
MSSRSRKQAIVERASAVPESPATEIGDGLHAVAQGLHTIAGILSWLAASEHSEDHGRQRQMAAVIYRTSVLRFEKVKVGGEYVSQADIELCDRLWHSFFKVDPKKLPKR